MANFEVGNVVQLRSGGPKMTVVGEPRKGVYTTDSEVIVIWFDDKENKFKYDTFIAAILERV
ncbi:YodC family protein [Entomomonas asaccharolytica]|uniref:DUF2158 domain-containing protein n=1 Tax=Entomomonas asaccharolytica TaxID=2785331 RepID=A0A974NI96_9GAMM|nr:DUF2158 domain-containing protein [Entomomonas asaccharolytica]QQP87068.1 DUF2158 domain-containing protein [Entomomonas asaccharolytica]